MPSYPVTVDKQTFPVEYDGTEEELYAELATPEGEAALLQAMEAYKAASPPPASAQPEMSPETRFSENILGKIPEGTITTPAKEVAAGAIRLGGGLATGAKQLYHELTGNKEQAEAMGKLEEISREHWDKKYDKGVGWEDLGESLLSIATLPFTTLKTAGGVATGAIKGKSLFNNFILAAKGLKEIKTIVQASAKAGYLIGGTAGGNALLVAAPELIKAKVKGEDRVTDFAATAATGLITAGGFNILGKGAASIFGDGFVGKALTQTSIGKLMGASPSEIRRGMMGKISQTIFPRQYADKMYEMEMKAASAANSPQQRAIITADYKAKLAQLSKDPGNASAIWSSFNDLVMGPLKRNGTRRGSFVSGAKNAWAKQQGIEPGKEASAISSQLYEVSKKQMPDGTVGFDRVEFINAWKNLRGQENFQKTFGRINDKGTYIPNLAVKKIDKFAESLLNQKGDTVALDRLFDEHRAALNALTEKQMQLATTAAERAQALKNQAEGMSKIDNVITALSTESAIQDPGILFDVSHGVWEWMGSTIGGVKEEKGDKE